MSKKKSAPQRAGDWQDFDASHVKLPPSGPISSGPGRTRWAFLAAILAVVFLVLIALQAALRDSPLSLAGTLGLVLALALQIGILVFLFRLTHSLAFFRRFIRPGLRRLLEEEGHIRIGNEKLFRGRKTIIMKIDMANYTRTTFQMPYGMRRLFQDLWFTLIDQAVADKVFLDKSLGDGSLYFFEDRLPGGSATAAFQAAVAIREKQVQLFDQTYQDRLQELLANEHEIAGPANAYLQRYEENRGESFWERRTFVRIALVTGYVDEGLWGLASQSHYDVHGAPLVLAARIEPVAQNGEIVFDQDFLDEIEEESPGLVDRSRLEHRSVHLKGIGDWEIYALPASSVSSSTSSSAASK